MRFNFLSLFASIIFILMNAILPAETVSERNKKAYEYLDNLAVQAGTDKNSNFHNYTKVYAKYFDSMKADNIRFMEIGIYQGNSVKLWESYFVNADLHFVDINAETIQYHSDRAKYHFVDQAKIADMQALAKNIGGNFDIIIDDGGHTMNQQINSFKALFPSIKSGGVYIIEDLHTSYWSAWGGGGAIGAPAKTRGTCTEFLKDLIDNLNYTAGVTTCADIDKISPELRAILNTYQSEIDSIHFYQSLCFIFKK